MKTTFWKTLLALLLALLMICGLFSGCNRNTDTENTITASDDTTSDGTVSLRVVTEKTGSFMMNDLTEDLIGAYQEEHKNVVIELEILPTDKTEREFRLDKLRAAIMAGDGPDIYLLPSEANNMLLGPDTEMLFRDVEQSMHNELFADVNGFYSADEALAVDELQKTVMDAGTIDNARYILPLRFDFNVILINPDTLANHGIEEKELVKNSDELLNILLRQNDTRLFCSAGVNFREALVQFPALIDYEKDTPVLSQEDISGRLRNLNNYLIRLNFCDDGIETGSWGYKENGGRSELSAYINGMYWNDGKHPFYIGPLTEALQSYIIEEVVQNGPINAYPMRNSDGSLVAEVTYWGAIDSNCEHQEIAYDFLRQFLSREAQWELNRSEKQAGLAGSLYEEGYPVRIKGSVEPICESLVNIAKEARNGYDPEMGKNRILELRMVQLPDIEFSVLNEEIDYVRFHIEWENEIEDVRSIVSMTDFDLSAEAMYQKLLFHAAEG